MSILLDAKVLSELLRAQPSPAVLSSFADQSAPGLFVSAVTQAEMQLGAGLLPAGRRRDALQVALQAMFEADFQGRVLPFGAGAGGHDVDIVCRRRALGRPVSQFDAEIAAIARQAGFKPATRNAADLEACGLVVVNPWLAAG